MHARATNACCEDSLMVRLVFSVGHALGTPRETSQISRSRRSPVSRWGLDAAKILLHSDYCSHGTLSVCVAVQLNQIPPFIHAHAMYNETR